MKDRVLLLYLTVLLIGASMTMGCSKMPFNSEDFVPVHFYISDHSPKDNPVELTLMINKERFWDGSCRYQDPAKWKVINTSLAEKTYELEVFEKDHGLYAKDPMTIKGETWVSVEYWYNPDLDPNADRMITIRVLDSPEGLE